MLVLALPITIIGANFAAEYSQQQKKTDKDFVGIAIGEDCTAVDGGDHQETKLTTPN